MAKLKRIITAGPLVAEAIYPAPAPHDSEAVRRGTHSLTTAAQARMNLKYAYQKLEFEIAANYGARDLFITLTYADDRLPAGRKAANARVSQFVRRLRAERKKRGQELRYIYVTEHRHGDGRWHHHLLINSTGDDTDALSACWPGGEVEMRRMRLDRDHTYEALARYLTKELRDRVGQRLWSGSRNLRKPERERFYVPDDTPLQIPQGCTELVTHREHTAYGSFQYIKYLSRGWETGQASRSRARRRRR